jgi:hypothetical protein
MQKVIAGRVYPNRGIGLQNRVPLDVQPPSAKIPP